MNKRRERRVLWLIVVLWVVMLMWGGAQIKSGIPFSRIGWLFLAIVSRVGYHFRE